jgi:hypothetical protein
LGSFRSKSNRRKRSSQRVKLCYSTIIEAVKDRTKYEPTIVTQTTIKEEETFNLKTKSMFKYKTDAEVQAMTEQEANDYAVAKRTHEADLQTNY